MSVGECLVFRASRPRATDCGSPLALIWFLVHTSCPGCTFFLHLYLASVLTSQFTPPADWLPTEDGKVTPTPQRAFPFCQFLELWGRVGGGRAPLAVPLAPQLSSADLPELTWSHLPLCPRWGGGRYWGCHRGPQREQATAGQLAASPSCRSLPRPRPPEAAAAGKVGQECRGLGPWPEL